MSLSSSTQLNPHVLYGENNPNLIRDEILADILENTAQRFPDKAALVFQDQVMSYGTLDERDDQVASALLHAGVRSGHIVGLWLPRGIDLLVMQAGIAKTGAVCFLIVPRPP